MTKNQIEQIKTAAPAIEILAPLKTFCQTTSLGELESLIKVGGVLIGVTSKNDEKEPEACFYIGFPFAAKDLPTNVKKFRGDF